MKERPIIMSGPMVRAVNDRRKTQTRRPVGLETFDRSKTPGYDWTFRGRPPVRSITGQKRHPHGCWQDLTHAQLLALCPYGVVGDRLWVRETWQAWRLTNYESDEWEVADDPDRSHTIERKATSTSVGPWRPSIFMPRWASRITLEITEVRVQRLQQISEEDAKAEGVASGLIPADEYGPVRVGYVLGKDDGKCILYPTEAAAFAVGWDSINAKHVPWDSNPWVWAISFARVP